VKTSCPQCGAEIEFRFDDSFVRVCGHCRAAVARTDRGVETLGQVADLTPFESPLALFAEGRFDGQSFLLVGKAQVRHAAGGLWQEWYAKFSGRWGWLAEAQGRFTMTFEVPNAALPPHFQLAPGAQVLLPTPTGMVPFTVGEIGVASYEAAAGELPYRLAPRAPFRYADLSDGRGGFATIDYGAPDGKEPPTLYLGRQLHLNELHISGGEAAPPLGPTISSQRLACPSCGGSLELRAPDAALRVVCPYCNSMLDVGQGGALSLLAKLRDKATPTLRLGTKGKFLEGELTIIGYLLRSAQIDGTWYPFEEYLLFSPALGFRWLVCSDGHWSYVQPVSPGAIKGELTGLTYQGVTFKRFISAPLRVDRVLGEFYWRVAVGETTTGTDHVAPPAMLSSESSSGEVNWSLSTYLTRAQVVASVGDVALPAATGVAPNQPWPHRGIGKYYGLLLAAMVVVGIVMAATTTTRNVAAFRFDVPSGKPPPVPEDPAASSAAPPSGDAGHVYFTDPFELRGGENIEISLGAPLSNNWMYVVADVVNEGKGTFVTFDANLEYYHGYEEGESWSEGSSWKAQTMGPLPAGTYVMRLEAQHGDASVPVTVTATIRQNVFQTGLWGLFFILLLIPGALFWLGSRRFESKRWENSESSSSGSDDSDDSDSYDGDD
jgi:Domain of unknown function (DUF4178)